MNSNSYLTAIRTLSGHPNFQDFEHFVRHLAYRKFRNSKVEKMSDRSGSFDFLVYNPDGSCVAIEAKATNDQGGFTTATRLKTLIRGWEPKKLKARLEGHRRRHSRVSAIIATTATISSDLWNEEKSNFGLDEFELWDANNLAAFAANDWAIASFFPGLAEQTEKYRNHSLDALRVGGRSISGVSVEDLINEEERSSATLHLGRNTLIVGRPYIGKTCWAIRRAWRTCSSDPVHPSVLWFNVTRHSPEELVFLNRNLPHDEHYVLVIDDIHFARNDPAAWTAPVSAFVARRPDRVRTVWVARDESIVESLSVASEPAIVEPFPLELMIGLFLDPLQHSRIELRVVAALESGLDPALGRAMKNWPWDSLDFGTLVNRIREVNNERVQQTLVDAKHQLGPSYVAYLGLLPFGSIGIGVKDSFIAEMSGVGTADLSDLVSKSVCTRRNGSELLLSEHPFQLLRTLNYVDEHETEKTTAALFAHSNSKAPVAKLADAVLCRYIEDSGTPKLALQTLNEYAEWAGVLGPMESAARYLVETTRDGELRTSARKIAMKLSRTIYPSDEGAYLKILESHLRWWEDQHGKAVRKSDEFCDGNRLDLILYEEAYIHYLCERYETASTMFRAAVDAGFRAIDRA
jgi:hypothetical protein